MDLIFDFIIETVFEGAFGSFTDNNLPKSVKIAIMTVCNLIVAGLFSVGLYLADKSGDKTGFIIFTVLLVLDIVVYFILLWCVLQRVKKVKNKGDKNNEKR